jgi:hypothetical protein
MPPLIQTNKLLEEIAKDRSNLPLKLAIGWIIFGLTVLHDYALTIVKFSFRSSDFYLLCHSALKEMKNIPFTPLLSPVL